jgi:hypothetical protein
LIFSSYSSPPPDDMSLTDPDQVPTPTSFAPTGTPSVAPSDAPLPSGLPARIVPGSGSVDPSVDDLNGFTLIALLLDQGFGWDFVVQNPEAAAQILSYIPPLIQTALDVTGMLSFPLRHFLVSDDPSRRSGQGIRSSGLGSKFLPGSFGYLPVGHHLAGLYPKFSSRYPRSPDQG